MGFLEEKERLAGLDAESSLARARADFDSFWRAFDDGRGRSELERALATARYIAEGDYDAEARRQARRLAIAAREKFARCAEAGFDGTTRPTPAVTYLHLLAETFLVDNTIVDDGFLALETRLRAAAAKSLVAGLSVADRRAVLRELGTEFDDAGSKAPG